MQEDEKLNFDDDFIKTVKVCCLGVAACFLGFAIGCSRTKTNYMKCVAKYAAELYLNGIHHRC